MSADLLPAAAAALERAYKVPLRESWRGGISLSRREVEALIPHRDLFLFLDTVESLDTEARTVVARYDLSRAAALVAGHFPGRPILPGVVQIEAIGQAGIVVEALRAGGVAADLALTHVTFARFIRRIAPEGTLEVCAQVFEDGLFVTIVGQCLWQGAVCSAAAVSGVFSDG